MLLCICARLGCCFTCDALWHQGHELLLCVQAPPVLKLLFGSLRGYAGEINPAAALDAVATGGNVVIVDIRTSREKENGGVPDLPFGNR